MFIFCCYVAIRYLLSAHDVESIILNTLAISFIMQIDDLFFSSLVPDAIQNTISKIKVNLPYFPNSYHTRGMNRTQKAYQIYTMFLHLPICILVSIATVILYDGVQTISAPTNSSGTDSELGWAQIDGIESYIFFGITFAITTTALLVYKFMKFRCRRCKQKAAERDGSHPYPSLSRVHPISVCS